MNLSRKMRRASQRRPKPVIPPKPDSYDYTHEGIFCDCHGTLYGSQFGCNELLVNYLNAKHEEGVSVILFSTEPVMVRDKIQHIGLHPEILMTLRDKRCFYNENLAEWIDDDPIPLISADKIWHPTKEPAFQKHMKDYLASRKLQMAPASPAP